MRTTLLLLAVWAISTAHAEVYRWGTIHYSDSPPSADESESVDVGDVNTAESVEVESLDTRRTPADDATVVMYSASWCGYCDQARAYFRRTDIPFEEYDVEESRKGRRDYAAMEAESVPIIIVGNRKMVGFTPARFERLYDT